MPLMAYLNRRSPAWREDVQGDPAAGSRRSPWNSGKMTEEEVYQILGLQPAAHRPPMQKWHPDQKRSADLGEWISQPPVASRCPLTRPPLMTLKTVLRLTPAAAAAEIRLYTACCPHVARSGRRNNAGNTVDELLKASHLVATTGPNLQFPTLEVRRRPDGPARHHRGICWLRAAV